MLCLSFFNRFVFVLVKKNTTSCRVVFVLHKTLSCRVVSDKNTTRWPDLPGLLIYDSDNRMLVRAKDLGGCLICLLYELHARAV